MTGVPAGVTEEKNHEIYEANRVVIRGISDIMILTGNFSILGNTHPLCYQLANWSQNKEGTTNLVLTGHGV